MKLFITILLFAAASANSTTTLAPEQDLEISNIITNGQTAPEGKAPYIVNLRFQGIRGASMCGGSIIGHTWVLTAAHCSRGASRVTIHYGSHTRGNGDVTHTVSARNFINHRRADIALIRTPYVNFNARINAVRLPSLNERSTYVNQWTTACGWGQTQTGRSANLLQCVDLQVISNAQCARTYGPRAIQSQNLCVSTAGGRSICFGDSGGPLVTRDQQVLVGVSSFVSGRGCTSGRPAGFARVTSHLDWIRRQTGISY